jgi:hypothetical protein
MSLGDMPSKTQMLFQEYTMSRSWGTDFVIVNDVHQRLSQEHPGWEHWATIRRGLDEYIVFHCNPGPEHVLDTGYAGRTYIEKLARDQVQIAFVQIENPVEFEDVEGFARAAGLLHRDGKTELKLGYWYDDQFTGT